jgi:phosphatidylserine/phosphatidylglycerophosphate/cardiolipin synthase-like enzyme
MTTAIPNIRQPQQSADASRRFEASLERALRSLVTTREEADRPRLRRLRQWWRTIRSLRCLGGITLGNQVRVFCDGDALFETLWADIDAARESVWLDVYCIRDDRVGRRTVDALARARRRGCDVILLYDCVGSHPVHEPLFGPLRECGAAVIPFNPIRIWPPPRLLTRDHRKIFIVDRRIAYCGGMNVSEEYAGERHGVARFHDCQLRLEGPCVADFERIFNDSLGEARDGVRRIEPPASNHHLSGGTHRGSADRLGSPYSGEGDGEGGVFVQVLASNGRRSVRSIQRALRCAIRRATVRCWITTPYFVPPLRLRRAMSHAAKRGVDVRLLTAGVSDVPLSRWAGRYVYWRLLRDGVRIYEMFGRTLHTKRATVDGLLGTIGSFNLDTWSDRRNLEVAATLLDPAQVGEFDLQFERDLALSEEVTLESLARQPWHRRARAWLAYQILRW